MAHNNRGNVYQRQADYDRAIADYNQALKLQPDGGGFYSGRSYAYALKGDYDRALADANQALKLKPDSAGAYDSCGFVFAGKGDFERAIADYNEALKLIEDKGATTTDLKKQVVVTTTSDVAEIYYHRGLAYRKQNRKEQAIADFKKTLEFTKEPQMNMTLGKVLKNHRAFPTDESALKVVYLAIQTISKKWTMPIREGRPALNQFAIAYDDRFPL